MSHSNSRAWVGRVIAVTLISAYVPLTMTACFGSFTTVRKVYNWNETMSSEKWLRWGIFLLIGPVYGGATGFDLIFTNSVEFWTGRNPMAAIPGSTRVVEGPNGERATLTMRGDDSLDVVVTAPGEAEQHVTFVREAESVAAYDGNGVLVARVGDGPDGEAMLLAGGGADDR